MHSEQMIITGYDDPILTRAGILSECTRPSMAASIHLHADVSPVFPYLNAVEPKARWYAEPNYIQFSRRDVQCTLYPDEAIVMPFSSTGQALWYINELISYLNDLYTRRETVTPDYKRMARPVSAIAVYKLLPGTNCQACGFTTCLAFAAALGRNMAAPHHSVLNSARPSPRTPPIRSWMQMGPWKPPSRWRSPHQPRVPPLKYHQNLFRK